MKSPSEENEGGRWWSVLLLPDDNDSLQGERGRVELNTSKIKVGAVALGPDERSAGRELHFASWRGSGGDRD